MKIDMRRLTLTAVLLSASTALPSALLAQSPAEDVYADYYGSGGGFVSETAGNEGAVQQIAATMFIGDDVEPSDSYAAPQPLAESWSEPTPYPAHSSDYSGDSMVGPYQYAGDFCDTGCAPPRRGAISRAINTSDPTVWMKAELLLWFPQGRDLPPLGVASAQPGLPTALNHDLMFHEAFGNDLTPGFRGDIGRYFAGGRLGLGGRVWVLGDDDDSVSFGGDGSGHTLGIPFFNTNGGFEDAVLVGFDDGVTQVAGNANVDSSLSVVAAELYGRALLGKSRNHRLELIGGYSHFNISDDLYMSVNRSDFPQGNVISFRDEFRTRNEFHGGQIGSEVSLKRGRWTANALTKVHLGNMSQRVAVNGSSTHNVIGAGPVSQFDEGLFARGSVQGVRNRDVFTFAPEMNLKLGYQFRQHVNFHVGYSFVYWSNVALAGDQIDRNIFLDGNNLGNTGPDRFVSMKDSGFWVQGIDLGAVIEF